MNMTKEDKERVAGFVSSAMDVPADDGMVAAVYDAYQAGVQAGEVAVDAAFEAECKAHLKGTCHER